VKLCTDESLLATLRDRLSDSAISVKGASRAAVLEEFSCVGALT